MYHLTFTYKYKYKEYIVLLGPEKEKKNEDKNKFVNKQKKITEIVNNTVISPRKKNILGRTFETLISVEKYEKKLRPDQLKLLKRGENLVETWLQYEKELYNEGLVQIRSKRKKRQVPDSGK